jgi:hypothetical protein
MTVPVEIGLKTLLLASAPVAALIVDRFAPILQSQGTERPFIVYSRVVSDPQHHLGGFSGLSFSRFQLDLFADTAVALYNLREAVRNRLDGYKGTVAVGADSIVFQCIELVDEQSSGETPNDGTDEAPQRFRMDFRISALEPIPTLT